MIFYSGKKRALQNCQKMSGKPCVIAAEGAACTRSSMKIQARSTILILPADILMRKHVSAGNKNDLPPLSKIA